MALNITLARQEKFLPVYFLFSQSSVFRFFLPWYRKLRKNMFITSLAEFASKLTNKCSTWLKKPWVIPSLPKDKCREYLRGKYHCTIDLLFVWFGISCMTTDTFCFYLQNRLIKTSKTGGQWYSMTSPFSIPW